MKPALHPLALHFEKCKTGDWAIRSEIRRLLDAIELSANEAALCLAPTDDGNRKLEQASNALNDLDNMIEALRNCAKTK